MILVVNSIKHQNPRSDSLVRLNILISLGNLDILGEIIFNWVWHHESKYKHCFIKLQILRLNFWQKIDFWPKFRFSTKISIRDQNLNFLATFPFLNKMSFFCPKFLFLSKIMIFLPNFWPTSDQNFDFRPKFRFLTKISIFDQNFNFRP